MFFFDDYFKNYFSIQAIMLWVTSYHWSMIMIFGV